MTSELQSPTGYTSIYAAWLLDFDNADGDFDDTTAWMISGTSGRQGSIRR